MYSILSHLRTVITRFARNESGNVIILVAGAMIVMVIAVGVAVDLAREQTLQSSMANAADAAALASGVAVSNAIQTGGACVSVLSDSTKLATCETTVAQDSANKFYKVNFPNQYQSTAFTPVVTLDEAAGTITLTAQTTETTDFLSSVGVTKVALNVYSKVKLATGTCGTASGVPTSVMPTASAQTGHKSLCANGETASVVTGGNSMTGGDTTWNWTCTPSSGTPVSCSAPLKGSCDSAATKANSAQPSGTICDTGTASSVAVDTSGTAKGEWTWSCTGAPNATADNVQCYANLKGQCNTTVPASSSAPSGETVLCSAGVPTDSKGKLITTALSLDPISSVPAGTIVPTGPWTWSCKGTGGYDSSTCYSPLDGEVGSANNKATTTAPVDTTAAPNVLCKAGVASGVSGNGIDQPWSWTCTGSTSETVAGTTISPGTTAYGAAPLDGSCGSANGSDSYSTKPANTSTDATVLCASGNAPSVSGSGTSKDPWSWTCDGSPKTAVTGIADEVAAGSPSAVCTATGVTATVTPINGACGAANGQTYSTTDTIAALCTSTSGAAKTVSCASGSTDTNCWTCDAGNSSGTASKPCGYKLTSTCPTGTYGTAPDHCYDKENINFYVRASGGYFGFALTPVACAAGKTIDDGCPGYMNSNGDPVDVDISGASGNNARFDFQIYFEGKACFTSHAKNDTTASGITDACYDHIWGTYVSATSQTHGGLDAQTDISAIMSQSGTPATLSDAKILEAYKKIPAGKADPRAVYCGADCINFVGLAILSPLKVNINGGNALLNSDTPMTFSLSHKHANGAVTVTQHKTSGSLNQGEAWLMLDRNGNGLVHDGVVDGDDLFTDHDGAKEDAYEDLATTFASSLKIDEHGRSYIPLHVVENKKRAHEQEAHEARKDKRAGKERELDPSLDLKLLDSNNNVLFASDYFDRIYVDHNNTAVMDPTAQNYILQTSLVRTLNGELHQSVDQWFGY